MGSIHWDDQAAVNGAQAVWQVLQLRQAQRLAFEALFGWTEERILVHGIALANKLLTNC